ncbi:hypothetical protein E3Q18_03031 [Wallemia mellicola]|nr:hypothetical protein E3Q19_02874 [Wallemia mellicola]TIB96629.1 hypothetical protein E3Q18_03031 [Wallemia mellicola]TIC10391.1 hypothetical protein E3Q15_03075 [Wallemia mellicola]TIC25853.1 hypothetical protein E3Q11_03240 [Wallemia mellicola]
MEIINNLNQEYLLDKNFNLNKFLLSKSINNLLDYEKDLILLQHQTTIKIFELIYKDYNNFINLKDFIKDDKLYLDYLLISITSFKSNLNRKLSQLNDNRDTLNNHLHNRQLIKNDLNDLNQKINFINNFNHINNLISSQDNKPKQLKRISLQFNKLIYLNRRTNEKNINKLKQNLLDKINNEFFIQLNSPSNPELLDLIRSYEILSSLDQSQLVFRKFVKSLLDKLRKDNLFEEIINTISSNLSPLINLFENCQNSNKIRQSLLSISENNSHYNYFDSLYLEVESSLINKLGLDLFSIGKPNLFHKNYNEFQSFITNFETFAPSIQAINNIRSLSQNGILQRFQLNNYFQLRFKELVSVVEGAFHSPLIYCQSTDDIYTIKQTERLAWALNRCWTDEVVLDDLLAKFWKVTLQLLSRYKTWLDDTLDEFLAQKSQQDNDQKLLEFLINSRCDIDTIFTTTVDLWNNKIKQHFTEILKDELDTIQESLFESLDTIKLDFGQNCLNLIISIQITKLSKHLSGVKSVYKLSAPRKHQDKPSEFIDTLINDLISFNNQTKLDNYKEIINEKVTSELIERYFNQISEIKSQESSFIKYKRGLGSSKDSNQINKQIDLDLDYFKLKISQFSQKNSAVIDNYIVPEDVS